MCFFFDREKKEKKKLLPAENSRCALIRDTYSSCSEYNMKLIQQPEEKAADFKGKSTYI